MNKILNNKISSYVSQHSDISNLTKHNLLSDLNISEIELHNFIIENEFLDFLHLKYYYYFSNINTTDFNYISPQIVSAIDYEKIKFSQDSIIAIYTDLTFYEYAFYLYEHVSKFINNVIFIRDEEYIFQRLNEKNLIILILGKMPISYYVNQSNIQYYNITFTNKFYGKNHVSLLENSMADIAHKYENNLISFHTYALRTIILSKYLTKNQKRIFLQKGIHGLQ